MQYAYRYRVVCETDGKVYTWADSTPTECPNNAGHTIDSNPVIVEVATETGRTSEGISSTTADSWQEKLDWMTIALSGLYALHFYFEVKTGGVGVGEARVRNVTDGTDASSVDLTEDKYCGVGGHKLVAFTGAAKQLRVQWKAAVAGNTMYVRRARLSLQRVGEVQ